MLDLDSFFGAENEGAATAVADDDRGLPPAPHGDPRDKQGRILPPDNAPPQEALDDLAEFLLKGTSGNEEVEAEQEDTEAEPAAKQTKKKEPAQPRDEQPIAHDPRLLYQASRWGITADQAATYSDESLRGVVLDRERRYEQAVALRQAEEEAAKKPAKKTEIPLPEFKVDDDADPAIKSMAEEMKKYAAALKAATETEAESLRKEVTEIKSEADQAAQRELRVMQAKTDQAIDDEVASWGEDFAESFGIPSQAIRERGTERGKQARTMLDYIDDRQGGWARRNGRLPSLEEAVELTKQFTREVRFVVQPDMAKKVARKQLSDGLKRQKGAVALRPGKARDTEPPEQSDDAAKASIGDYFASIGHNPWGKRKTA